MASMDDSIEGIIDPGIAAARRRRNIVLAGRIIVSVGFILAW